MAPLRGLYLSAEPMAMADENNQGFNRVSGLLIWCDDVSNPVSRNDSSITTIELDLNGATR